MFIRFLIVLYFLMFAVGLALIGLDSIDHFPHKVLDYVSVNCNNGSSYKSEDIGVNLYSEYISTSDQRKFKIWCWGDKGDQMAKFHNKVSGEVVSIKKSELSENSAIDSFRYESAINSAPQNYNFDFHYNMVGSWSEGMRTIVSKFVVLVLILEMARRVTRFIITGKRLF